MADEVTRRFQDRLRDALKHRGRAIDEKEIAELVLYSEAEARFTGWPENKLEVWAEKVADLMERGFAGTVEELARKALEDTENAFK
jgi:hypothetical protein